MPYGGAPLLGHVLQTARSCPFDQLLCVVGGAPAEVRRWVDPRGPPLDLARSMFGELGTLHGDKAVWRLLDQHTDEVVDVGMDGRVPS